jgi:2-aminobenzoate-CoA ligase
MSSHSLLSDRFAPDNLPPSALCPDLLIDGLNYPDRLNAAVEMVDRNLKENADRIAILAPGVTWTYAELARQVNRIANVLTQQFGLVSGNRVLLRAANNPMMVAAYLAVLKAGGIAVATMPLLRTRELFAIIDKAQCRFAITDHRLRAELEAARADAPVLEHIISFGGSDADDLDRLVANASDVFQPFDSAADDVCLIAFTSGTTGVPKGTMHFHRDLLAICDSYSAHLLRPTRDDRFIGSPPLAFTFGLGGLVLFPFRVGASTVLLEKASPDDLLRGIAEFRATVVFTAPTAYRAMLANVGKYDISSLRRCISAGEALPHPTFEAWCRATGLKITEGIGSTEMLHIFIGSTQDNVRPGATGLPVPGYEAKIIGPDGQEVPDGTVGRLAVRGPTGCRYLADQRQRAYVLDGWNITGDIYLRDSDGYYHYQARSDDMIVSAGYNIAGPEVEATLLAHPAVRECGVVGAPDPDRGAIVKAYVMLAEDYQPSGELIKTLQDYVKAEISPYKYPRAIVFVTELPKTSTGKLQRSALREAAAKGG